MKLTYDPRSNAAHLRLQERSLEVETIRVSDELNVDIAPDGTVYGIEQLNANERQCATESDVSSAAAASSARSPRRGAGPGVQ